MKTFIIQLERHDDAVSTRDKMEWGSSQRILLVYPERGQVLTRRVDLVLLQRHGLALGAQMALVTGHAEVRQYARELGIPVFKSVIQAQKLPWQMPLEIQHKFSRRAPQRQALEKLRNLRTPSTREMLASERLIVFVLGIVAVLALGMFVLPGATISLAPVEQEQQLSLEIWANPAISSPTLSGNVPATMVRVEVERSETVRSTGHALSPVWAAAGEVTFTNLTDRDVIVPAGSIVRTQDNPPVRFETVKAVSLIAGGPVSVTAPVRAVDAGTRGNVAAGEIIGIEGSAGPFLAVTNHEKTRGGTEQSIPAPSREDHARARQQLLDALTRQAEFEIKDQLPADTFLLTPTILIQEIEFEDRQPGEGQPGEQLTIKMRANFAGWYVRAEDMRSAATIALGANIPPGYSSLPDTLQIALEGPPLTTGDTAGFKVRAEQRLMANWSQDEVVQLVRGKERMAAVRALQERLPLKSPPKIDIWPEWWPRLPHIPFRIQVGAQ